MGLAGLKPGTGSGVGFFASVMVSPTLISLTSFMEAAMYPTSPAESFSNFVSFGVWAPTSVTSNSFPVEKSLMRMPGLTSPSKTLTKATAPLYWS